MRSALTWVLSLLDPQTAWAVSWQTTPSVRFYHSHPNTGAPPAPHTYANFTPGSWILGDVFLENVYTGMSAAF